MSKRSFDVACALVGLAGLVGSGQAVPAAEADSGSRRPELLVRSGGHVRKALAALLPVFERQAGVSVKYTAGGSGEMLAAALASRDTDLYVAADLRQVRRAEREDVVAAKVPLFTLNLAIVVKKGNPRRITGLGDLARAGMRVFIESPQGCQIGGATQRLLRKHGIAVKCPDVRLEGKPPTLRSCPRFLEAGLLDAAIVWDSAARQLTDKVDTVPIPAAQNVPVNVVAIVFRFARHGELAERLMSFLRSEQARATWEECGLCKSRSEGTSRPASPDAKRKRAAERMIRASRSTLAPVYAPLAEQIVRELRLSGKTGVGIDVGSGPGDLIVELCQQTQHHWINADINANFFGHFLDLARRRGVGNRVSVIQADAQALPFRDDYADVIVSRGSYHFWADRKKGFREIYRVLKPGGVAYVGRGFPDSLPVSTARQIRAKQGKRIKYDRQKEAAKLRGLLDEIGIAGYRLRLPRPPDSEGVNYGLWVTFQKPPPGT